MSIRNASHMEQKIAKALVDTALAKGYRISVNDGEEPVLVRSTDRYAIMQAMASTDMDILLFTNGQDRIGSIVLIWGNEGDLISDASDTQLIEDLIRDAQALL